MELVDNPYVSTHKIICEFAPDRISSRDICSEYELFDEDIVFKATDVIETPEKVVYVAGTIGYPGDRVSVEFIYDRPANKIYCCNKYRTLDNDAEYDLFAGTFEISYNKYWQFVDAEVVEKKDDNKYEPISEKVVPYYRFPRTKDGIPISRLVYNIFKVFRDETAGLAKPVLIIPYYHCIYRQVCL
jgi:hypothetical protein